MDFTISLKVTGKQGLLIPIQYTGAEQKDFDLIVPALKAEIKKLLHHDAHKDPVPSPKEIIGSIVLPEGKGTWEVVASLVGTPKDDFSITWPKTDKGTAVRIENTILKLGIALNAE